MTNYQYTYESGMSWTLFTSILLLLVNCHDKRHITSAIFFIYNNLKFELHWAGEKSKFIDNSILDLSYIRQLQRENSEAVEKYKHDIMNNPSSNSIPISLLVNHLIYLQKKNINKFFFFPIYMRGGEHAHQNILFCYIRKSEPRMKKKPILVFHFEPHGTNSLKEVFQYGNFLKKLQESFSDTDKFIYTSNTSFEIPLSIQTLELNLLRIDKISGFCATWCIFITRQLIKLVSDPKWISKLMSINSITTLTKLYQEMLLYIIIETKQFYTISHSSRFLQNFITTDTKIDISTYLSDPDQYYLKANYNKVTEYIAKYQHRIINFAHIIFFKLIQDILDKNIVSKHLKQELISILLTKHSLKENPYEKIFLEYLRKYFEYQYPEITLPTTKITIDTSRAGHFLKKNIIIVLNYMIYIVSNDILLKHIIPKSIWPDLEKYMESKFSQLVQDKATLNLIWKAIIELAKHDSNHQFDLPIIQYDNNSYGGSWVVKRYYLPTYLSDIIEKTWEQYC